MMSSTVREYRESDFEQVWRISNAVYARRTGSSSLALRLRESRMLRKYVVTNGKDRVDGYGLIWEQLTSPRLILKVEIAVYPEFEAADKLFDTVLHAIERIGPHAVQARTFTDQTRLLQLYEKHGFAENHQMIHVYLPLTTAHSGTDRLPAANIENKLNAQGIALTTLAEEIAADAHYFAKLQALNDSTWGDYPAETLLPPAAPNDRMLTHEDNIPEAYFIAKRGQAYIGHSHLMRMPSDPDHLLQGLTATRSEFRGEGIATALKMKGIEYARSNGYQGIYTSSRNTNAAMQAVNRKLGWLPHYGEARFDKIY